MEVVEDANDLVLPVVTPVAQPLPLLPYPTMKESWGILGWYLAVAIVVGTPVYVVLNKALHLSKTAALLAILPVVNLALLGWLRRRAGARWVRLQLTGREQWWVYAVLPVLVLALAMVLSLQQLLHLPDWNGKTFEKATQTPLFATVIIVLAGPIFEELLFRGVILQGLLRSHRPWVAIAQSAVLFGIMHLNPTQSINAVFIGLVFGWLYYRTRSLWLCMASHCLFNSLAFGSRFAQAWLKPATKSPHVATTVWMHYAVGVAVSAVILAVILWYIRQTTAEILPKNPDYVVSTGAV